MKIIIKSHKNQQIRYSHRNTYGKDGQLNREMPSTKHINTEWHDMYIKIFKVVEKKPLTFQCALPKQLYKQPIQCNIQMSKCCLHSMASAFTLEMCVCTKYSKFISFSIQNGQQHRTLDDALNKTNNPQLNNKMINIKRYIYIENVHRMKKRE